MEQDSRLDRLFKLLDTASPNTRAAAAQQIGQIQSLQPQKLSYLLSRLKVLLRSHNWDTRVAAGQAVGAICSHVDHYSPPVGIVHDPALMPLPGLLCFDDFDVVLVVERGAPLLASEGKEFTVKIKKGDPQSTLEYQRRALRERLGLDNNEVHEKAATHGSDDLINLEDIKHHSVAASSSRLDAESIVAEIEKQGQSKLSARERNMLKRRAKSLIQGNLCNDAESLKHQITNTTPTNTTTTTPTPHQTTAQNTPPQSPQTPAVTASTTTETTAAITGADSCEFDSERPNKRQKLAHEIGAEETNAADPDPNTNTTETPTPQQPQQWPFTEFCAELCVLLLSPVWEVRHGAAIGLREVISSHGGEAGKQPNATVDLQLAQNNSWLEDMAIRVICVFALDRFGDYAPDQVVAPVRETCGQILGGLVKYMTSETVMSTVHCLLRLVQENLWEVQHSAMLGVKYVVGVRDDLAPLIIPVSLPFIITAITEADDDVRAVAADILLPVVVPAFELLAKGIPAITDPATISSTANTDTTTNTDPTTNTPNTATITTATPGSVFRGCIERFQARASTWSQVHVIHTIWHTLCTLGDLSASTASILALLSAIYQTTRVSDEVLLLDVCSDLDSQQPRGETSTVLSSLVPRLFPFFRNPIVSVRRSVVATVLHVMHRVQGSGVQVEWCTETLANLLRHLFQSIILERVADISDQSQRVWELLVRAAPSNILATALNTHIPLLTLALCTPPGVALPSDAFLRAPPLPPLPFEFAPSVPETTNVVEEEVTPTGRKRKARKRGAAGGRNQLQEEPHHVFGEGETVSMQVSGARALGALFAHLPPQHHNELFDIVLELLTKPKANNQFAVSILLAEWAKAGKALPTNTENNANPLALRNDVKEFLWQVVEAEESKFGVWWELEGLKGDMRVAAREALSAFERAGLEVSSLMVEGSDDFAQCEKLCTVPLFGGSFFGEGSLKQCQAAQEQLMFKLRSGIAERTKYLRRVTCGVSEALLMWNACPRQPQSILRALQRTISSEPFEILQLRCPVPFVHLLHRIHSRNGHSLVSKMVLALLKLLFTLTANTNDSDSRGLEASLFRMWAGKGEDENPSKTLLDGALSESEISRRGAVMVVRCMAQEMGADLFSVFPTLKEKAMDVLFATTSATVSTTDTTDLCRALVVVETLCGAVHETQVGTILALLPHIHACLCCDEQNVRTHAADCFCSFSDVHMAHTMEFLITHVISILDSNHSSDNNSSLVSTAVVSNSAVIGILAAVWRLVSRLNLKIATYSNFFVVPVLARMSDPSIDTRRIAAQTFAALVPLLILEPSLPDPSDMSATLSQNRLTVRAHLAPLVQGTKGIHETQDASDLTGIVSSVSLRPYQLEGVAWMRFLRQYNLHGVLCDDMGLGKTLQTLCTIAIDHHANKNLPPSLVVCPATLLSHWAFETERYVGSTLKAVRATNLPSLTQVESTHNQLVVTSYDLVRNNADFFRARQWNYLVLDEGHIIKNPKSKTTLAVKMLVARHRLILSGTPVQNNVLELWSLFDFLMPGFLGTHQEFNTKFSKPIVASNKPKCSSKDSERGTLALQSLHKQVLPFILRRMKEDVLRDLPPKIIQDFYCDLSPIQHVLYHAFTESGILNAIEKSDTPQDTAHSFRALVYLRKLCSHPALVLSAPSDPNYTVAMAKLKENNLSLHDIQVSPKLEALKQLLTDCCGGVVQRSQNDSGEEEVVGVSAHRVLVFAQLKGTLDLIEHDLLKTHMPTLAYLRMDGNTPANQRHDIAVRFNTDPSIDLLLLTTQVGGLGLTLTGADTVVFVEHDWNPSRDHQAMDRAHRLGQTRVVNVYRLIMKDTLEEKILGLQRWKTHLANTVVNLENASMRTMDTNKVLDLLESSTTTTDNNNSNNSLSSALAGVGGGGAKVAGLVRVLESCSELAWNDPNYEQQFDMAQFLVHLKRSGKK